MYSSLARLLAMSVVTVRAQMFRECEKVGELSWKDISYNIGAY